MNTLEKKEYYGSLLSLYGALLSKTIQERMRAFYLEDYSITEIAQDNDVSRNAVFESITQGEEKLDSYERKLGLGKRNRQMQKLLDQLKNCQSDAEKEKLLDQLKGIIEHGI